MNGQELQARGPDDFLRELVHQIRLHGDERAWDGRSDAELLAPLLAARPEHDAELDAEQYFLVELFHEAVARVLEHRTGLTCAVMMRVQPGGDVRIALLAGRLVVVSREVRDVRRFGFASLERLAEAGERLVEAGVEMIDRFPGAASHGA